MHGTSFPTASPTRDAPERHTQQYFEIFGNRAMYKDGWLASLDAAAHPMGRHPDTMGQFAPGVWDPDADPAELYYLPDDFSQAHDLAAEHPDKVAELRELFWQEAEKYGVLPLLGGLTSYFGIVPPLGERTTYTLPRHGAERRVRDDPADLQPLLRHHRRPGDPARRRRGRDRGRGRPPGRLLAVRPGRQAAPHLLADGRAGLPPGRRHSTADRQRRRPAGVRRRRPTTRNRRRGDAVRQRRSASAAAGWTTPCRSASPATPAWTSAATTAASSTAAYADRSPFAFTGTIRKVVFDIDPILTEEARAEIHERMQHAALAHGIGA